MGRTNVAPLKSDANINYTAHPSVRAFHKSDAFFRALLGPVGGGKSSATWVELFRRACEEHANDQGMRSSMHLVVRDTYAMLKSTSLDDFKFWFGHIAEIVMDSPIRIKVNLPLRDGTTLDWNLRLLSMDGGEKSLATLRGMQISGAYLNEAYTLSSEVYAVVSSRVGRYRPAGRDPKWKGIIADSNYGYQKCHLHTLYINPPEDYEFFEQPPAALWNARTNKWELNPFAENLENLPGGLDYYKKMLAGMDNNLIKQFMGNQWGTRTTGKQVWPEYLPSLHLLRGERQPDRNLPLILGQDFGLHAACAIGQLSPQGKLIVFEELWDDDVDLETFITTRIVPTLRNKYPGFRAVLCGDPSGMGRSSLDKRTAFDLLKKAGIVAFPAVTNEFVARRDAVKKFLQRNGGFQVHHSCERLIAAFEGGYGYKKLQSGEYSDQPEKNEFSHCFVGSTAVVTSLGSVFIADVQIDNLVLTTSGYQRVTATMSRLVDTLCEVVYSDGSSTFCTPDHPFIVNGGVLSRADALQYSDLLTTLDTASWQLQNNDSMVSHTATTTAEGICLGKHALLSSVACTKYPNGTCTATCGSTPMGRYLKATKSITLIATGATTLSKTFSALLSKTIEHCTNTTLVTYSLKKCVRTLSRALQNGMGLLKVSLGIKNTGKIVGSVKSALSANALTAGKHTLGSQVTRSADSAPCHAKEWRVGSLESTTLLYNAPCAATTSPEINTKLSALAVDRAPVSPCSKRVVSVRVFQCEPTRVYDLTVDVAHEFFADGVLVSNCADALQYLALYAIFGNKNFTAPGQVAAAQRKAALARMSGKGDGGFKFA